MPEREIVTRLVGRAVYSLTHYLRSMYKNCFLFSLILFSFIITNGQQAIGYVKAPKTNLDDFMDQRFGMFIHWGPVALRGTEIGWSRGKLVPLEEYDTLYKEFNPVLFDAEVWVKTAKAAGMKYLTITAKHHDGFCLWPTAYSSYNIMQSPYKKDIVGALAKACGKYGIKFCVYFSVLDWHDPDYPVHNQDTANPDAKADLKIYAARMKNQLREIVTNYHPYMLWFDGNWETAWKNNYAAEIYSFLKKLNPGLIINNRLGANHIQKRLGPDVIGDFATPEQMIGEFNLNEPWETCMTLCTQWAWKPNDAMKSLKECIQTLTRTAGGNGNLLFNVGPMMDGRIESRQTTRLAEIGKWLNKYGESIYGTKGGPFKPDSIFSATRKGSKIYIHLYKKQGNLLELPAIKALSVTKAYFMKGAQISFSQNTDGKISLVIPEILPDENDSVIVLETNGNAERLPVVNR